jgi:hypothetical protein
VLAGALVFENQLLFIADMINGTVAFFWQMFGFMDGPVTYIVIMVIDLAFVPLFARSVYAQYAHPHEYYHMPLMRKVLMGATFIIALFIFGYANFLRFLPPTV